MTTRRRFLRSLLATAGVLVAAPATVVAAFRQPFPASPDSLGRLTVPITKTQADELLRRAAMSNELLLRTEEAARKIQAAFDELSADLGDIDFEQAVFGFNDEEALRQTTAPIREFSDRDRFMKRVAKGVADGIFGSEPA